MNTSSPIFRKAVIGGFNKDDVIDYIEKIRNEFSDYKKSTESLINDLYEKISTLNRLLEEKENAEAVPSKPVLETKPESDMLSVSVNEITKAAAELKTAAEMICGNFDSIIKKIGLKEEHEESAPMTETEPEEAPEEAEEMIEEAAKSFFDDILKNTGFESKSTESRKTGKVSQFDDLLKI